MTKLRYLDPDADTSATSDSKPTPRSPGWVKMFGVVGLVIIVLFVIFQFVGGGSHGPGRHLPAGGASDHAPPADVIEHGTQHP